MLTFEYARTKIVARCAAAIQADAGLRYRVSCDKYADECMAGPAGVEFYDLIQLGGLQEYAEVLRRNLRDSIKWEAYKQGLFLRDIEI